MELTGAAQLSVNVEQLRGTVEARLELLDDPAVLSQDLR
jgi:porphobilinogen deaminase